MKKIYSNLVLALTFGTATAVLAQPTITSAVIPQVGYTYNMMADTDAVDLPTFTVSAGSASSQTWNYSNEFNNVYGETNSFVSPSSGQGSSNFPSATLAMQQPGGTDWVYFVGNTNGLYLDGAYVNLQGTNVALDLTPNSLFIPTPSTYGFTNNTLSTATFTAIVSTYTVQVRHFADRTVTADAFGSLTTPTATYPNTLRLKTFEATIDSVFFDVFGNWTFAQRQTDSSTTYNWMQNTQDAMVMQIDLDKNNVVTKANCLQSFSNGIVTVSQTSAAFKVYPNPASHSAYLTYENKVSGQVSLNMYDMSGRMIGELMNEYQTIGNQKVHINVESMHLPHGLYFLQLKNSEGTQTLKLSVN